MIESEIVTGLKTSWSLLEKLGEGDAGEVYRVESLIGGQSGILKRPRKSAFPGETARQAGQIRDEGRILQAISVCLDASPEMGVSVPNLLDQNKNDTDFNSHVFIIISQAEGFDLAWLARLTQLGISTSDRIEDLTPVDRAFLENIATTRSIPTRILLEVGSRILAVLEKIHSLPVQLEESQAHGLIWNDIKPEHLFWEPARACLTMIDWGNGQFLDADGTTADRKYSWADDYRQLFEGFGRFMQLAAPGLIARTQWPDRMDGENARTTALTALQQRLQSALADEDAALAEACSQEAELLESDNVTGEDLARLDEVHLLVLAHGGVPDYPGAQRFAARIATGLVTADRLDEIAPICDWARRQPGASTLAWDLTESLAHIPGRSNGEARKRLLEAIQTSLASDWEACLWNLLSAIQAFDEPEWWHELTLQLRRLALGVDGDRPRPLVAVNRLALALQSASRQPANLLLTGEIDRKEASASAADLARRFKDEVVTSWTQVEPGPPFSGLSYAELDDLLAEAGTLLPEEQANVTRALESPKAQAQAVVTAWDKQDYLAAGKGLRRLLMLDPDRRRVLRADRALRLAPMWLERVHIGPHEGENFLEYMTTLEFDGRELRNMVAPSGWLDGVLEICRQLRRGAWPGDLLAANPSILREAPWLGRFERAGAVSVQVIDPETEPTPLLIPLSGVSKGELGPGADLELLAPLDTWLPEARGSSARVAAGKLRRQDGSVYEAAVKLMRMDKINYALPLFHEEVQVLRAMQGVGGVTPLLECGFIRLEEGSSLPFGSNGTVTAPAVGEVVRIGADAGEQYQQELRSRCEEGWIPYLAIKKQTQEDSLLLLCDAGMRRGQFLPVITLLEMTIQICDILAAAHARNVVYRDHKILHYYWKAEENGIYLIDWNVARFHPEGLTEIDLQMDLVQFGARGLHHILTGRSAPGALPLGPTRPEEIEQSARSYQAQWTYDDQRLSIGLRTVLERALAGAYSRAEDLRDDLKSTCNQLPDPRW